MNDQRKTKEPVVCKTGAGVGTETVSNAQESENNQAAIERVREGARLLNAGDYQGAIDAFTEAIRLDAWCEDARLLQWQALRLRDRPTLLEVLSLVVDVPIYILRYMWWALWDKSDAMDRAHGMGDLSPPPQSPDLKDRLAQQRLEALLSPAVAGHQQPPNVPANSNQSKVHHQPMMAMRACPNCGQLPQFPSAFSCANCGTTTRAGTAGVRRELDDGSLQRAATELAALRDFGIDACALERNPVSAEWVDGRGWIEIAEGPIRWMYCSSDETICCVPDSRIQADSPSMSIEPHPVKSFHLLGRGHITGVRWALCDVYRNDVKDFSQSVAYSLTLNTAVTQELILAWPELHVETAPVLGCWTIGQHYFMEEMPLTEWTRELWDCYQAIAQSLLVMPLPTDEVDPEAN